MAADRNLRMHHGVVARADRERLLGQRGCVVWLTGLSGAGKSTIARALEARLFALGRLCSVLDGDNLRHGLCADLGFDAAARSENIRRAAHTAALFVDLGAIVVTAFVSPFRADREAARDLLGADMIEVHVDAPLAACEQRDPKGLYKKARAGQLADFTGVDSPYEPPADPDIRLRSADRTVDECVEQLLALLRARGAVPTTEAR
ncbi:MAG: adenylyl-sulfate kinase [Planctomycetes bacterium]|nr:adenylyl-sulfate kinase [Planctomycetota bacterium]